MERYRPGGVINISGRKMFREIIAPFREVQKPWCGSGVTPFMEKILRCPLVHYITNCQTISFLGLEEALCSVILEKKSLFRAWLGQLEDYT